MARKTHAVFAALMLAALAATPVFAAMPIQQSSRCAAETGVGIDVVSPVSIKDLAEAYSEIMPRPQDPNEWITINGWEGVEPTDILPVGIRVCTL